MALTARQVRRFQSEGYVVAPNLLVPEEDLQQVMDEYASVLDRVSQRMLAAGEIDNAHADLAFGDRLISLVKDTGYLDADPFDINLPVRNYGRKWSRAVPFSYKSQFHFGPAIFGLLRNERLLDAVQSLIGSEIYSNPVQHVRIKVPEHLLRSGRKTGLNATTQWHQDNGVVTADADKTDMLTVWLPLTEASEQHGCLKVVPHSHVEGLRTHCPQIEGAGIPDALVPEDRVQTVPMSRGDVLFMHRRCMHASLTNVSEEIRWSFDLRYQPIGQPSGRSSLPGFVARSRENPESELDDPVKWRESWLDARDRLLSAVRRGEDPPRTSRWNGDHEMCA